MKSQLLTGTTWHARLHPRRHAFVYRMLWLCLDVDELPTLDRDIIGFGYNRRSLVSIADRDYAGPGDRPIRAKLVDLLASQGITSRIARIDLITLPKIVGYAFNPVSFFRCYDCNAKLLALIAEVHNTFGESHHYILQRQDDAPDSGRVRFTFPKTFYVSPFYRVDGAYELALDESGDLFKLTIDLRQGNQIVLTTGMSGKPTPLSRWSVVRSSVRLPFIVMTVIPRITWQAVRLYVHRRIEVVRKPAPSHAATIGATRPSLIHRMRESLIGRASGKPAAGPASGPVLAMPKENAV